MFCFEYYSTCIVIAVLRKKQDAIHQWKMMITMGKLQIHGNLDLNNEWKELILLTHVTSSKYLVSTYVKNIK